MIVYHFKICKFNVFSSSGCVLELYSVSLKNWNYFNYYNLRYFNKLSEKTEIPLLFRCNLFIPRCCSFVLLIYPKFFCGRYFLADSLYHRASCVCPFYISLLWSQRTRSLFWETLFLLSLSSFYFSQGSFHTLLSRWC